MSVTADYNIQLVTTGDLEYTQQYDGVTNTLSPAVIQQVDLVPATNTITVPSTLARSVTIIPPASNTLSLTIKSTTADVGMVINPSSPMLLSFGTTGTTRLIINAASTISGVRFVFLQETDNGRYRN